MLILTTSENGGADRPAGYARSHAGTGAGGPEMTNAQTDLTDRRNRHQGETTP